MHWEGYQQLVGDAVWRVDRERPSQDELTLMPCRAGKRHLLSHNSCTLSPMNTALHNQRQTGRLRSSSIHMQRGFLYRIRLYRKKVPDVHVKTEDLLGSLPRTEAQQMQQRSAASSHCGRECGAATSWRGKE